MKENANPRVAIDKWTVQNIRAVTDFARSFREDSERSLYQKGTFSRASTRFCDSFSSRKYSKELSVLDDSQSCLNYTGYLFSIKYVLPASKDQPC